MGGFLVALFVVFVTSKTHTHKKKSKTTYILSFLASRQNLPFGFFLQNAQIIQSRTDHKQRVRDVTYI